MRRAGSKLSSLGWRGVLAVMGGAVSLFGCGLEPAPKYGVQRVPCTTDSECVSKVGPDWHCVQAYCESGAPSPDAGK
jgi:hypothetical protein